MLFPSSGIKLALEGVQPVRVSLLLAPGLGLSASNAEHDACTMSLCTSTGIAATANITLL